MNSLKLFVGISLLAVFGGIESKGQEMRAGSLRDEFGRIECEDLAGRLDSFISDLNHAPEATGYVVISSNSAVADRTSWLEKFVDGYARFRRFDEHRFVLLHSTLPVSKYAQLWLVDVGTQLPVTVSTETKYRVGNPIRRLRIYSDFGDQGPCYTGPPFRMLSKYLKANPQFNANIAVGSESSKSFRNSKRTITDLFRNEYSVSSSRIRFYWTRTPYDGEVYELWMIRRKGK